jgi:uncharacterized protein (TIGR02145 family)
MTPSIGIGISPILKRGGSVNLPIKYGLLYNGYAVLDPRGLTPTGWHLPTYDDLYILTNLPATGLREVGNEHWNNNGDGTNLSGFTARGSGYRGHDTTTEDYEGIKDNFHIWTGYVDQWESLNCAYITDAGSNLVGFGPDYRRYGKSIRYVRDTIEGWMPGEKVTDYDGNIYDTVLIALWDYYYLVCTVQNIAVTHYNNGDVIPEITDVDIWRFLESGALCAYNNDWGNVFE